MIDQNVDHALAPALLRWWDIHGRKDLPWQRNPNPYRVWVSEIMLQQTQVATVERYYDRFMAAFPRVAALAEADQDQVLHLWSGLGYYARARNMHQAAQIICDRHEGELPTDLDALIELPGIGRSTAGAILALSMNQFAAILDGNARRVLARIFGVEGWPGRSAVNNQLWALAEQCTPRHRVAHYTQAIMDIGASVCTRTRPGCVTCPLGDRCRAHLQEATARIPASRPRRDRPVRSVILAVVVRDDDGAVLLERRPPTGVWGGLWGFPEVSDPGTINAWCLQHVGSAARDVAVQTDVSHSFSHFDLTMTPVAVRVSLLKQNLMDGDRWLWYNRQRPAEVGLAAPVSRLLEKLGGSK